ncbi:hypothetical protein M758_UG023900 [Ceratodon purpureus]|nr:hypothetical protein M758_UG023900 [Ceratodon purpureus]
MLPVTKHDDNGFNIVSWCPSTNSKVMRGCLEEQLATCSIHEALLIYHREGDNGNQQQLL